MSPILAVLLPLAILAYGFVGGVFLAFSDFIMRSLSRTGGLGGVETMQIINREVFRWVFMGLFLGMAAVSVALAILGLALAGGAVARLIACAAAVYLVGCFGVTVLRNVPMNEALARMDLTDPATQAYWSGTYVPRWTFWNTLRSSACGLSAGLLLVALVWPGQG